MSRLTKISSEENDKFACHKVKWCYTDWQTLPVNRVYWQWAGGSGMPLNTAQKQMYAEEKARNMMVDCSFGSQTSLWQDTKKVGCPAVISISKFASFPKFKLQLDVLYRKRPQQHRRPGYWFNAGQVCVRGAEKLVLMTAGDAGSSRMKSVRVVVVGAGVIGFSTAVCIAESLPFCSVTLLAEKFSPDTTSDGAAGILFAAQFPDIPLDRQKRWFKDSFDHLLAIAQSEHSPDAGVMLSSGCQIFKEVPADKKPFWSEFVIGFRSMTDRELKRFPDHRFGQAFTTIKCECPSYLPWLQKRFRKAGGQVEQRKVNNLQELSNSCDIIVNCSGLGSKTLVGDTEVYPVRGQVLKVKAPWLQHFIRDGDGKTYIYPGIHGVTIGGTRQEGDWRLQVDEGDTKGILERCSRLEPSLSKAKVLSEWVGLRPSRRNPKVERELVQLQGHRVPVVHNYGHGGWGVTFAWGTALDALGLVRQCLHEMPLQAKL